MFINILFLFPKMKMQLLKVFSLLSNSLNENAKFFGMSSKSNEINYLLILCS